MATLQFKLPIGAKRQVTIPRDCMNLLSLEEGGELLLEIVGDHAVLLPVVSIPRRDLPEALRKKFESRRGKKASDMPLGEFLGEFAEKPAGDRNPGNRNAGNRNTGRHRAAAGKRAAGGKKAVA
jgi:antitoxin component of MazEF toxin-antitoxin module